MLEDWEDVPRGTLLDRDVCIEGVSEVGIALALELAGTGWSSPGSCVARRTSARRPG